MICLNLKDKPAPEKREVFDSSRVRRNTWCGPYVAAAVCKIDYETAYQTFRKITGKRHVAGTHADEVKRVCSEHGVKSGEITRLKTKTAPSFTGKPRGESLYRLRHKPLGCC